MLIDDQIKDVGATARNWSKPTVVSKWVINNIFDNNCDILDYGCGKFTSQGNILRNLGFNHIDEYDIAGEGDLGVPPSRTYEVVMLSNVINVQPNVGAVISLLDDVIYHAYDMVVVNIPSTPRFNEFSYYDLITFFVSKNRRIHYLNTVKNLAVFKL